MLKLLLAFIIFILINIPNFIIAQESNSIQINGGIIMPMSSSKGLSGSVQFNFPLTKSIELYAYGGYAVWDRYNVTFQEELSTVQKQQFFKTYLADDHTLVPLYIGSKINISTNKIFSFYTNFEIGYSRLNYNSYGIIRSVNPETGEVLGYYPDVTTIMKHSEDLFGLGIGAGLSHPITRNFNLILAFKLNTYLNDNYSGFFSSRGTYTMYNLGFSFII
jgi:hypothetical protein